MDRTNEGGGYHTGHTDAQAGEVVNDNGKKVQGVASAVISLYESEAKVMHDDEAKADKRGEAVGMDNIALIFQLIITDIMAISLGHEVEHTTKQNVIGADASGLEHEGTPTVIGDKILKEMILLYSTN